LKNSLRAFQWRSHDREIIGYLASHFSPNFTSASRPASSVADEQIVFRSAQTFLRSLLGNELRGIAHHVHYAHLHLPIIRNVPERQSVDYLRHGTTTLFAALDVLNGNVIAECNPTHTAKDFILFLKKVNKACDPDKELHIVADNLSAHKTKSVYEYLDSIPGRFKLHFIPTHSSWLNLVERWFAEISNKQIRRGSYNSITQLTKAIKDFIKNWNKSKRTFKWTKEPDVVLAKIKKATS